MISPAWAAAMARYNAWQNGSLYDAAATLSDTARKADRGAFFGSIHATLNHLLWADEMWMSRLSDVPMPAVSIPGSASRYDDFQALRETRGAMDIRISKWADGLTEADILGDLVWFSRAAQQEIRRPRWLAVTHLFNHQTHHRGQVHAMLTSAGAKPGDSDVIFLKG